MYAIRLGDKWLEIEDLRQADPSWVMSQLGLFWGKETEDGHLTGEVVSMRINGEPYRYVGDMTVKQWLEING